MRQVCGVCVVCVCGVWWIGVLDGQHIYITAV